MMWGLEWSSAESVRLHWEVSGLIFQRVTKCWEHQTALRGFRLISNGVIKCWMHQTELRGFRFDFPSCNPVHNASDWTKRFQVDFQRCNPVHMHQTELRGSGLIFHRVIQCSIHQTELRGFRFDFPSCNQVLNASDCIARFQVWFFSSNSTLLPTLHDLKVVDSLSEPSEARKNGRSCKLQACTDW